jgi:hypothetical protein
MKALLMHGSFSAAVHDYQPDDSSHAKAHGAGSNKRDQYRGGNLMLIDIEIL